jgi:hypothetical protein
VIAIQCALPSGFGDVTGLALYLSSAIAESRMTRDHLKHKIVYPYLLPTNAAVKHSSKLVLHEVANDLVVR